MCAECVCVLLVLVMCDWHWVPRGLLCVCVHTGGILCEPVVVMQCVWLSAHMRRVNAASVAAAAVCVAAACVCACAYEFPCARGSCHVHAVSFALHSCVRGLWPLVAACVHVEGRAMRGCGCFRVGAVVIAHVCTAFACVPCVWPCVCLLPAAVLMHVVCVNTRLCIYAFCQTQLRVVVVVLRLRLSCAVVPLCVAVCVCRYVVLCIAVACVAVCAHCLGVYVCMVLCLWLSARAVVRRCVTALTPACVPPCALVALCVHMCIVLLSCVAALCVLLAVGYAVPVQGAPLTYCQWACLYACDWVLYCACPCECWPVCVC